MPLPFRWKCQACGEEEALFVWDPMRRCWFCNGCGRARQSGRPKVGDAHLRRKARKGALTIKTRHGAAYG